MLFLPSVLCLVCLCGHTSPFRIEVTFIFVWRMSPVFSFLRNVTPCQLQNWLWHFVSCIMKAQVKPYLRQLVMVTATGKGTYWTCTTTKGSSSGSTNWYLGCCLPFPVLGHLRFQHSQCLGQYNASDNRYSVTSITLLRKSRKQRFLIVWVIYSTAF